MGFKRLHIIALTVFILIPQTSADDWESPCPELFVYEPQGTEPGIWYGIVKLLSYTQLQGFQLRVILDKAALELGNWFGEVNTVDSKEFLIDIKNYILPANSSQPLRFYVKYKPNESPPKIIGFRLNDETVCFDRTGTKQATNTFSRTVTNGNIEKTNSKQNLQGNPSTSSGRRPDPALSQICGKRANLKAYPLVRYGQSSSEGEWPWQVAIYRNTAGDLKYICGGSLVSKWLIVTAAHCVTDLSSGHTLNPRNYLVHLGTTNLIDFSSGIQTMQISKLKPHPNYTLPYYHNDIALIHTAKPVEFTPYVTPICLWEDDVSLQNIVGRLGTVAGWGLDEKDQYPGTLKQVQIPIVDTLVCVYSKPDFFGKFTSFTKFCAGFRNGTSACVGDSGSGLVLDSNDKWFLRGVVSISVNIPGKANCDPYEYVVFTDVAKYVPWIRKHINE